MITAQLNAVGLYASGDDAIEVWGDAVGIADAEFQLRESTIFWVPVEASTWTRIKAQYR